ncbi:MAG TPA: glycosyltransferase family 4 protein [Actinomycetes bacterium]|nr:glycosyltransferase family 4 protein [Actinomycetes bacterium]
MRILMVSPYPPLRDGIAAYAVQAVAALRSQGHEVEVLSPGPSAAHHHLELRGPRGPLALARRVGGYDKVVIQFHPEIFYRVPSTPLQQALVNLALLVAVRAMRRSEVIVHEIDYRVGRRRGLDGAAARRLWRQVDTILLHTEVERRDFIEAFGVRPERALVTAHGAHFVRRTSMARQAARRSLGIPEEELVFLAIGFIQPHKGFDRAVLAFDGLAAQGCSLHVVGSVRLDEPAHVAYLAELQELVASTPGAHLHDQYVSDELFDRWLVASDVVVLPYRNIWSSGVLERALLYERRVIATAVGGLRQQASARPGITLVDEDGLASAMWRARELGAPAVQAAEAWPDAGADDLREQVQGRVVARARKRRGTPARAGGGSSAATTRVGQPLRRLPPLGVPAPVSARPGVSLLKRLVRRATAWQIDPLVAQVNALREGTIQALERAGQQDPEPSPSRQRQSTRG